MSTINFGIDLGTTNSLIARAGDGGIEVFKNPVGHKETLPSCVAFRNGRIIVGEKARELIEKDPANVFQSFKRRMGTDQRYFVESITDFVSPVQLSSYVLKELKSFIHSGEPLNAAIITIPASFDTLQSNATKEAGHMAGIKEVILLQEPIAASLAYANKVADKQKLSGIWLIYDLGGGTFDAAIVEVREEMRVLDHRGNNYLGGMDFDSLLVEHLVVPYLEAKTGNTGVLQQMQTAGSPLNKLYYILLHKAEEAKKELSVATSTEIEFDYEDANGKIQTECLLIQRSDFENLIRSKIDQTIQLVNDLLRANQLQTSQINQVLLVGGSTYIPLVKKMLEDETGITVNNSIDPTTAIAAGAAYFASSKNSSFTDAPTAIAQPVENKTTFTIKHAYNRHCSDTEEVVIATIEGPVENHFYRIVRHDGGFDSGLIPLRSKISAVLPLLSNHNNIFELKLFDNENNLVFTLPEPISINQGTFSIYGQTLPNDICLEIDNIVTNKTNLELVFSKNALLPLKKTLIKTLSRSIQKGNTDDIVINMFEGNRLSKPSSCISLGFLRISGENLQSSIYKGSDIEITFEISESREIKVTAFSLNTDQQFSNIFKPEERTINRKKLMDDLKELKLNSQRELTSAIQSEKFDAAEYWKKYDDEIGKMTLDLKRSPENDVTDIVFQIEERKRYFSQLFDEQNEFDSVTGLKEDYLASRRFCQELVNERGTSRHKQQLEKMTADESHFLSGSSAHVIRSMMSEFDRIIREIKNNDPDYIINNFMNLQSYPQQYYKDYARAKKLFITGEKAFEDRNYIELKGINQALINLLIDELLIRTDYTNTGLK